MPTLLIPPLNTRLWDQASLRPGVLHEEDMLSTMLSAHGSLHSLKHLMVPWSANYQLGESGLHMVIRSQRNHRQKRVLNRSYETSRRLFHGKSGGHSWP